MNKPGVAPLDDELRISPRPVLAMLLAGALVLSLWPEFTPNRERTLDFATLLFGALGVGWLLTAWRPRLGRWFTVVLLVAVIQVADGWLGVPGLLGLLAIPTALAAALISMPGALATALGEALLLIGAQYAGGGPGWSSTMVGLVAVWGMLGAMHAVYQPVGRLAGWCWQEFERAQTLLGEARDRRVELGQALTDLAHANRQLALANEKTSALRVMAEEAQRAKAAFVAKVSHEFRTPLNMIIGLVELIMETPEIYSVVLSPQVREDLRIVYRNSEHLAHLVNDVLDLTQLETGRLALHRERADLRGIIENSVAVVLPLLEKKGLRLEIRVADDLPEVYCDRVRIQQVLLNLLSNAARYTDAGGITVEAVHEDEHVEMRVADSGVGISPEDAERVFEPFCQGAADLWRDKGGSGLGLSISRQFIRLHGGRMWLHSELERGSTFCFTLPVPPPIEHIARPGHQIRDDWVWREDSFKGARAAYSRELVKRRVVVGDPTGVLCPQFARYDGDVEWIETRDTLQTRLELRQCPAHAVVLNTAGADDPWAVVDEVRREVPDTLIVACSVPPQGERAAAAGALGHLIKPVTRADLQEAIQSVGSPVKRILLVDDDADALRLFSRVLRVCDSRLEIVTASSGVEALNELRSSPPDLMLLDLLMPGMDGWEVLRAMRDDVRVSAVPTFLISAEDPASQPPTSEFLLVSMGEGLPLSRVLRSCLELSKLLLKPETESDLAPG